jgi:hypothetical protein
MFLYLWDPVAGQYVEYLDPLDTAPFPGATILDCDIADVDQDGRVEILVSGYLTWALPEAFTDKPLPLITHRYTHELRRAPSALTTSIWRYDGLFIPGQTPRFTRVAFPRITDKAYHIKAANLDGAGSLEVLVMGANNLSIYGLVPEVAEP